MEIIACSSSEHLKLARELFMEYARSLDFSLCFQEFDTELQSLPWEYAEPEGCILLAVVDNRAVGCVALRPLGVIDGEKICEMKRLYVKTEYRGLKLGRTLSKKLIEAAICKGYSKMRLDTVPAMAAAIAMYRSMGFVEIPPYRENPIPGAIYMELRLAV